MPAIKSGKYKVSIKLYQNSETRIVSNELNVTTTDIEQKTTTKGVKLYPNPVFDTLFLVADFKYMNKKYQITDLSGKIVLSGKIENENSTINISELPVGAYLFSIENTCIKFVKGN